ncbi:hypothetical protein FRC00_014335 [Tulasnella sp. 408]|nr:hypothetical protein FRC00_014335 [Tulasnella sp. 408]
MPIQQPSNQIKLTNVSIVRLKKGGKRFEATCYKNKVQEWRNGVETNLDDVLQISNVFVNVSKGQVAPTEDLKKAFGKTEVDEIVKEASPVFVWNWGIVPLSLSCGQQILKKGELQVGEKEREHALNNLWKEIATQVSEKVVDPNTQRPYPVGMIEKAMHEAGFSVKTGKSSKSQVLECIKLLQEKSTLPIQRARMRVRITMPIKDGKRLKEQIHGTAEKVEEDDMAGDEWETILIIDPGQFRVLNELLSSESSALKGKGKIETLTMAGASSDL